jgi:hypothetical protein
MNMLEKFSTMAVALFGAVAGLWGAYTAHDAAKFKQPFDERGQMASSFQSQIASAEKRKDAKEVLRVRVLYERFEEGWREGRKIIGLVAPVEALASTSLNNSDLAQLNELMSSSDKSEFNVSPKTLGAAYLALGQYENAVRHFEVASKGSDDSRAFALQSAAFGELAKSASTDIVRSKYEDLAADSFRAALKSPTAKPVELSAFANANAELKAILSVKGIEITDRETAPGTGGAKQEPRI